VRTRLFAAVFVAAVLTVPIGRLANMWNPNETSHLMLGVAMARGTVRLDSVIAGYGVAPQDLAERDGHAYSDKAPGLSAAAAPVIATVGRALPSASAPSGSASAPVSVPAYWPLHHTLAFLLVVLPAAWLALGMATAGRVSAPGQTETAADSWPAAILFSLATPILTYGSVLFSHVPAAALIGTAWWLAARAERAGRWAPWEAAACGGLAGLATATEYPVALLALVLSARVFTHRELRGRWIAFGGVAAGCAAALGAYHTAAFGGAFATGYGFKVQADQAAIHAQGLFGVAAPTFERLWGVLLSARRGLVFYCPMLLLTAPGLRAMWRDDRRSAVFTVVASVVYVAFAAGFVDWEGGWSAASRHLVPLLPILAPAFVRGAREWLRGPRVAIAAAALIGASAAAAVLSVSVTPYFPEVFTNPLAEVAMRSLGDGVAFRNIVSEVTGISSLAVFVAFAAAVLGACAAATARLSMPAWRRRAIVAFVVGVVGYPVAISLGSVRSAGPEREPYRRELLRRIAGDGDEF
jgi:hypothetical protein